MDRRTNTSKQDASFGSHPLLEKHGTDEKKLESTPVIEASSNKEGFLVILLIFALSLFIVFMVYSKFPNFDENEYQHLKLPSNIEDAKALGNVLSRYTEKYYHQVLGGVFIVYIFLQSFAIPGSIFLSILCGYLFSFYVALILVCLCSAIGASLCFCLSSLVGRNIVKKYFPEKSKAWSEQVNRHADHLLYYIIFLRITPFLPNWFINITSPVIGVPLGPFFLGTFLGVAPPSFVAIQAGISLQELTSSQDALTLRSLSLLTIFAILSLIPVIFKRKLGEKMQ